MDTWDYEYQYENISNSDGWVNFSYLYNNENQRNKLPFNHTFIVTSAQTDTYNSTSKIFNLTENNQVIELVLTPKRLPTLYVNVSDPRNQTITEPSSHWFTLWRYYQGQWHEGISRPANEFPGILMDFPNLVTSNNYSLRHHQKVWYNWYQNLNFSYYDSYLLANFLITENTTLNLSMTPARNDFPIRVTEQGDPTNNITGVTVILY